MTYQELADTIMVAVGGPSNIKTVSNCATRLRFTLNDESIVDDENVKSIDGVYGIQKQGGVYQVIVGSSVNKVYAELAKNLGSSEETAAAVTHEKAGFKEIVGNIFAYISAVGGGLAVPLISTGMIKVILTVLTVLGIITKESQTYQVLFFVADCCFYFLPVFVAIGASRKLGTDLYMSILVAIMVLHPTWTGIVAAKEGISLFGVSMPLVSYTSTFMPMLLSIYALYWVEKGVDRIIPKAIKSLFAPLLTLLVMVVITFFITGPLGFTIGKVLADTFLSIQKVMGPAFTGILAFALPILIMLGLHQSLGSVFITTYISTIGYDGPWGPANLCVNISILATCLAIALTTKDEKTKTLATSAGVTAGFGGITEPAIFGILTKDRKYLLTACTAAGLGGVFSAIIGLRRYVIASPNLLSLPVFIGEGSGLLNAILVCVVTAAVAFGLTYFLNRRTAKN